MISKTRRSGQKPRGRQLNAKVCSSESAIFRILVKVAGNPVTLKVDKPGIQADRFLCLAKLLARNQFWESQTVHCP